MEINSLEQLQISAGLVLQKSIDTSNRQGAVVLALHGDLGAGKTTFTQCIAKELGIEQTVTSPTFVIMKRYPVEEHRTISNLVHIDAYRIESIAEMQPLHFSDLLKEKNSILCIEWAEHIKELLPEDTVHLTFSSKKEERTLTVTSIN